MVAMPACWALRGEANATSSPRSCTCPLSSEYTPVISLISVDFPAPFSPTSACTDPACSSSETSSSARTPANRLLADVTANTGVVISVRRPGGEGLLSVGLVVLVVGGDGDRRGAVAVHVRLERGLRGRPERRVRLDHRVEVAVHDRLHGALRPVDRHDVHLGGAGLAGVVERGQRAQANLVVLGVAGVDVREGTQQRLGA